MNHWSYLTLFPFSPLLFTPLFSSLPVATPRYLYEPRKKGPLLSDRNLGKIGIRPRFLIPCFDFFPSLKRLICDCNIFSNPWQKRQGNQINAVECRSLWCHAVSFLSVESLTKVRCQRLLGDHLLHEHLRGKQLSLDGWIALGMLNFMEFPFHGLYNVVYI